MTDAVEKLRSLQRWLSIRWLGVKSEHDGCVEAIDFILAENADLRRKLGYTAGEPRPGVNIRHSDGHTGYVPRRMRHPSF